MLTVVRLYTRLYAARLGFVIQPIPRGAFPELMAPDYNGLVARLPGNGTPELSETSIPAFARAFDEVVRQLGPTTVIGVSIGALVALGMREPKAIVAVEPPVSTSKLWPMIPELRAATTQREFIRNVFGVYADHVEERGYLSLLDGLDIPTDVIVGEVPLFPERPVERYPSFVDENDRIALASHPAVTLHVAPNAGHAVPHAAGRFMHPIVLQASQSARTACEA